MSATPSPLNALRELLSAWDEKPRHQGTRAWLDALSQARNVIAEADKLAAIFPPVYDLVTLRAIAKRKGHSIVEDSRLGCYNVYDKPTGYCKDVGRTFCVGLREVAEYLDTLPDLT